MTRVLIADFGITQKNLANAVVAFYLTDSSGENTGVLAVLYQASTGTPSQSNPQTLDDNGMLAQDCWVDAQVMASISGISALTERGIKKIRQNPLEFALIITSASWAQQATTDIYGSTAAVTAAVAAAAASAVSTAADRVQTDLDAVSATASAATATTEAGIATTQATSATASATSATSSASTATTQAATATTQAGIATAQAVIATAEAVIATTQAGISTTQATASAASALAAASTITATSTTSRTIGTGSFTFTTKANKNFFPGQFIIAASAADGTNYIHGQVTSYSGTTLVMTESDNGGSGAHADWNISASGPQGASGSGAGTVTSASVASANGFAGTVANPTSTPAITIKTSITGIIKGDGTAISQAAAGTDYIAPSGDAGTPSAIVLTNSSGTATALNIGGNAATATTASAVTNATLTTALTVNTGTVTLKGNAANTSALTIGAGAVTVSGSNTGDQTISDATITTTDITTNNVSTSKHGFAPKAPNDATKYLDGTGAYSVPAGSGSITKGTTFTKTCSTISTGALYTNAHGMTPAPNGFTAYLSCTTADHGYSIGDIIPYSNWSPFSSGNWSYQITLDATNVNISTNTGVDFTAEPKAGGAAVSLTVGSWSLNIIPTHI